MLNKFQLDVVNCNEPIILIDGSIGNGKTVAAIARIHKLMIENPDSSALFISRTYLTSMMDHYRDIVNNILGYELDRPKYNHTIEYPNGSSVRFTNLNRGYNQLRELIKNNCKIICIDNLDNFEVDILKHLPTWMNSIQLIFTVVPPMEGTQHWIYKRLIKTGLAYRFGWSLLDVSFHTEDYITAVKNISPPFRENLFLGVWIPKEEDKPKEIMVTILDS